MGIEIKPIKFLVKAISSKDDVSISEAVIEISENAVTVSNIDNKKTENVILIISVIIEMAMAYWDEKSVILEGEVSEEMVEFLHDQDVMFDRATSTIPPYRGENGDIEW